MKTFLFSFVSVLCLVCAMNAPLMTVENHVFRLFDDSPIRRDEKLLKTSQVLHIAAAIMLFVATVISALLLAPSDRFTGREEIAQSVVSIVGAFLYGFAWFTLLAFMVKVKNNINQVPPVRLRYGTHSDIFGFVFAVTSGTAALFLIATRRRPAPPSAW